MKDSTRFEQPLQGYQWHCLHLRDMQGRYCQEFSMAKLAKSTNSGRSGNGIQPYAGSL